MQSINVDLDYFGEPRTTRLVAFLGEGAEVFPVKLWSYCGKFHAENGRLSSSHYSIKEIEALLGWRGPEGRLIEALMRPGIEFLVFDKKRKEYVVPDWEERGGHIAAFKERGRKAARARWDKIRNASSNAQASSKQSPNQLTNQRTR